MRMARINVYLPDELAREAKEAGLNISGLTQQALRSALAAERNDEWLDDLQALGPTDITHEAVLTAVAAAKDDLEGRG
jgi:post-segregation antitoxin (ccd killing protein)